MPPSEMTVLPPALPSLVFQPLGISRLVIVEIAVWAIVVSLGFHFRKRLDLWDLGLRI